MCVRGGGVDFLCVFNISFFRFLVVLMEGNVLFNAALNTF